MNYKLLLGRSFGKIDTALQRSNLKAINSKYPWGRNFVLDLKRFFDNGIDTIVDAGANVGSVAKEFAFYFPKAKIIAFEPILATYKELEKQSSGSKNIIPVHLALGEGSYQIKIPLNLEHTVNSITSPPEQQYISGYETINVNSLEAYAVNNNIDKIDILKIDVEGYEFKVLEGAKQFIQNSIKAIVLEVGYERCNNKVHFSDVEMYMENQGFQCCGIYELSKSQDKRKLYYSNNLYVRKSLI
jgi:FkbM family methyltransferase